MYRVFKNIEDYNTYTNNGQKLTSGDLYFIDEDEKIIFRTNNVDGTEKTYDIIETSGNIEITENGENIDVSQYATATVNVQGGGGSDEDLIDAIERDIVTLNIPSGVTTIRDYAFDRCSSLTSVTIPDTVTSIGESAFNNCGVLTEVTIPDTVTNIGESAFNNCRGLTSVTIGNGVTTIGNSTFRGCRNITSVTVEAVTPPTIQSSTFESSYRNPIYVPAESVDAYKAATNWKRYASYIQAIPTV